MDLMLPKIEKEILEFWQKNNIFKKSLEKTKEKPRFVFYEGPPFANGLPGIHHLLARAFKDIILRYKTMQGFFVERKAGWDTHGLPTEMSAEKSLKIASKKQIEENIGGFVKECSSNVFTYKKDWELFTERIGYWLDLENAYVTCSKEYIESLSWILKRIWDKGLLYQDYKVVPYCPRCGTSLSSHEVAQGYKTVLDSSVYVKFKVSEEENTYFLVWTTTPWTLPGNTAIAVNPKFSYSKIEINGEKLILAKDRLGSLDEGYKMLEELKGKDLVGLGYEPLFNFHKPEGKAWFVVGGNFVSLEEGTGLVHIAPAFGEDDMEVGKENNLPVILDVDESGRFKSEVDPWAGMFVKDADPLIIEELKKRNLLFKKEMYEHEYPFCYRCNTALIYKTQKAWYLRISEIRQKLIESNETIKWMPGYFKEGRFKYNLENAPDWSLSRTRYWGSPVPVWKCESCSEIKVPGSIEEIEGLSGEKINNLHRPDIDNVEFECKKCEGKMKRVPEVMDCWFESGAMPFAQFHYPFERKEEWNKLFPADFIVEYTGQLRGWFYYLHVLANSLFDSKAFKNVIVTGVLAGTDGRKMSKSYGNYPDPKMVLEKYGADVLRFYFMSSPLMSGDDMSMSEKDLDQLQKGMLRMLWNVYSFFVLYANIDKYERKTAHWANTTY